MEDNGVVSLATVREIKNEHEPLQKTEDTELCNDFIPDVDESIDCSKSDNADGEDFHNDEVVENPCDANDEHAPTEESSMPLTKPSLPLPLASKNDLNTPTRKFKCIKPSIINATIEHNKVKTGDLDKTKDELRKLASNFKDICPSMSTCCGVSNWNALLIELCNTLVNPTFIQNLKSSINRCHSGDNKLNVCEISQCFKIITALHFY